MTDTQRNMLIARIDRALDSVIAQESQKIENGLGVLSVVTTASPFIGLFGAVWGIMNAFDSALPAAGSTNPDDRGPGHRRGPVRHGHRPGGGNSRPAIAFNAFSVSAGKFTGRLGALRTICSRPSPGVWARLRRRRLRPRRKSSDLNLRRGVIPWPWVEEAAVKRAGAAVVAQTAAERDQRHAPGGRHAGAVDHLHDLGAAALTVGVPVELPRPKPARSRRPTNTGQHRPNRRHLHRRGRGPLGATGPALRVAEEGGENARDKAIFIPRRRPAPLSGRGA